MVVDHGHDVGEPSDMQAVGELVGQGIIVLAAPSSAAVAAGSAGGVAAPKASRGERLALNREFLEQGLAMGHSQQFMAIVRQEIRDLGG